MKIAAGLRLAELAVIAGEGGVKTKTTGTSYRLFFIS